ncbi:MAG TPA: hypothetical protein VMN36_08255 [Verrucomicrobiales bacterium]|nr:hypothetical protein [Verrucomicrobiales bacterium]
MNVNAGWEMAGRLDLSCFDDAGKSRGCGGGRGREARLPAGAGDGLRRKETF